MHEQYLAQKRRRLNEGIFSNFTIDRSRVLKRALEAPVNIGRRTLQTKMYLDHEDVPVNDSKQWVVNEFRQTFGDWPFITGFENLLEANQAYTKLLKTAFAGSISEKGYDSNVSQPETSAIPHALSWTSEITSYYSSFLEGQSSQIETKNFSLRERL